MQGRAIDIRYSRPLMRQFHYWIDRVPPWNIGGAAILLSGKGWKAGAALVSILATAFLYIKETVRLSCAKLSMLSQVEAIRNLSIVCDIYEQDTHSRSHFRTLYQNHLLHEWQDTFFKGLSI
jgi:hypothetical protein